jgi:hypothetical protein
MGGRIAIVTMLTVLAAAADTAAAVHYRGPGSREGSAVIEAADGQVRELDRGEILADLGVLTAADDREAVFEREIGDDEREWMRSQSGVAPDLQRVRLPRMPRQAETRGGHAILGGE